MDMQDSFDKYEMFDDEKTNERFRKELDKEKLAKRRKKNPGMKSKENDA